jgi:hypothetical protein
MNIFFATNLPKHGAGAFFYYTHSLITIFSQSFSFGLWSMKPLTNKAKALGYGAG